MADTRESIRETLLEILEEINDTIDYETETSMIDDGLLDSMEIINLYTEISEEFEIEISQTYFVPENFNSVDALVNMIELLQDQEDE